MSTVPWWVPLAAALITALITGVVGIAGIVGTVIGHRTTRKVAEDNRRNRYEDQITEAALELIEVIESELRVIDDTARVLIRQSEANGAWAEALKSTADNEAKKAHSRTAKAMLTMELLAPDELQSSLYALKSRHHEYRSQARRFFAYKRASWFTDETLKNPPEQPKKLSRHDQEEDNFFNAVKQYRLTTSFPETKKRKRFGHHTANDTSTDQG